MISRRPYLIRAMHAWMVDTDQVPYLLVDTTLPGVDVPEGYIEDDRIILNVSPTATQGLVLGDEMVSFNARFGGQPRNVSLPVQSVLAIYSRESGEGMMFGGELPEEQSPEGGESGTGEGNDNDRPKKGRPDLKVIK